MRSCINTCLLDVLTDADIKRLKVAQTVHGLNGNLGMSTFNLNQYITGKSRIWLASPIKAKRGLLAHRVCLRPQLK